MKRLLARVALAIFTSYFISLSRADVYVDPKIKLADACGYVLDAYGHEIPNVEVMFLSDKAMTVRSDEHGYFLVQASGEGVRVRVRATGFASAEQMIDHVRAPRRGCRKPLYVLLEVGDGHSMIRLKRSDLQIAKKG